MGSPNTRCASAKANQMRRHVTARRIGENTAAMSADAFRATSGL
jgi:hypothetical protein